MKISVIGCGYLGAVHAACMASLGHEVIGVDVDAQRVDLLNQGRAPFYEPGFPDVLKSSLDSGLLRFVQAPASEELRDVGVHFIAVGTPQSTDGSAADMSFVNAAADSILAALPEGETTVVVGKSTVPVGTAQGLQERFAAQGSTLVWNPEFLREGTAVKDTLSPDRIVYGLAEDETHAQRGQEVLDAVYAQLLERGIPRIITDYSTSELVKVAANSFLATKISFINAMAELCEVTGGDVTKLAEAIGHDERIGKKFLGAGVGFGGGCLPKDIRAFTARAEELGVGEAVSFLKQVDCINQRRRDRVVAKAMEQFDGDVRGRRLAILGAAFKANSDDIRESPALIIASKLAELGAAVAIYDPQAMPNINQRYPDLRTVESADDALRGAEMTLVLTEWQEFKALEPQETASKVARKVIVDGRNILEPHAWRAAGWDYIGMGR